METSNIKKELGSAVRQRRKSLGLSQEALAERANLHRTYVTDIERGSRNISVESISKLAAALGLSIGSLFSSGGLRSDSPPPAQSGAGDILLVEDDQSVRRMTRRTLETFGYQVCEAASAQQAFQMLDNGAKDLDLLLTDIVIHGGISGYELARQMQAVRPGMKVIFMSGYNLDVSGRDAELIRQVTTSFLPKPHSSSVLIDTVRRCLDSR